MQNTTIVYLSWKITILKKTFLKSNGKKIQNNCINYNNSVFTYPNEIVDIFNNYSIPVVSRLSTKITSGVDSFT